MYSVRNCEDVKSGVNPSFQRYLAHPVSSKVLYHQHGRLRTSGTIPSSWTDTSPMSPHQISCYRHIKDASCGPNCALGLMEWAFHQRSWRKRRIGPPVARGTSTRQRFHAVTYWDVLKTVIIEGKGCEIVATHDIKAGEIVLQVTGTGDAVRRIYAYILTPRTQGSFGGHPALTQRATSGNAIHKRGGSRTSPSPRNAYEYRECREYRFAKSVWFSWSDRRFITRGIRT